MQSSLHLSCSLLLFVFPLFHSSHSLFFHFPFFLLVFLSLRYSQFFMPVFTIIFPTFVLSLILLFTLIFLFSPFRSLSPHPCVLYPLTSLILLLFFFYSFPLLSLLSHFFPLSFRPSPSPLLLYPESSLFLFLTYSLFSPLSPSRSLSLPSFSPLIP